MPAESKSQQRLMGMAYAEQQGQHTGSPTAVELASEMSPDDVEEYAKTDHAGLPEKKSSVECSAFVRGFLTKCAEFDLDAGVVTRMVAGLCMTNSHARDAFGQFVKSAFDLSSLPEATEPTPVPSRRKGAESEEKAESSASDEEKLRKKMAGVYR